jgi:hypothetical protein
VCHLARAGCALALLLAGAQPRAANTECCVSVVPEFPPATAYGSYMVREGDPRSDYRPYAPLRPDPPGEATVLRGELDAVEASLGPYTPDLVPHLSGLGAAYLSDGKFPEASAAYARAIHLLRVNEGLKTPQQTPLVEQLIESRLAAGQVQAADDQQKYLFAIRRASYRPTDPEMHAAVAQYTDWLRAAYLAEVDSKRFHRLLEMIDINTALAEQVAAEHGDHSRELLPYLHGKLVAEYLVSIYPGEKEDGLRVEVHQQGEIDLPQLEEMRFYKMRKFNHRYGEETAERIRAILAQDAEATPEENAGATVLQADWYQWHRRYAQALPLYEQAWRQGGEAWRTSTFDAPLELPAQIVFQPGRLPLKTSHEADVRLRFDVTRQGKATDIDLLDTGERASESAVVRSYKFLRDMRFRPRIEAGKAVDTTGLERAYHIRY